MRDRWLKLSPGGRLKRLRSCGRLGAAMEVNVPVKPKEVRLDDEGSQLADFIRDNS